MVSLQLPELFHIVLVNERTGTKEYLTTYAMSRKECLTVLRKQSTLSKPWFRFFIEPLYQFTPHTIGQRVPYQYRLQSLDGLPKPLLHPDIPKTCKYAGEAAQKPATATSIAGFLPR